MSDQYLFYQDPYRYKFDARVLTCNPTTNSLFEVILDRTAFYPEGGGQPADQGLINDISVLDVKENQQGEIVHLLAGPLRPGAEIHGMVDWQRRFDHMQQHSGQHILSAIFEDLLQAQTVGFHLGVESTQIDLTLPSLTEEQVSTVETQVNEVVFANRPVSCVWVAGENLDQYPLRKKPAKSFEHIRLVLIDEIDCCPCGGTHVSSTGEIGLIKIRSWERKNNNIRIDFVCGGRALTDYQQKNTSIRILCDRLSVPPAELVEASDRQSAKYDALLREAARLKEQLNTYQIQELLALAPVFGGIKIVRHILPAAQPGDVSIFAKQIAATGQATALIAGIHPEGDKAHLVFCTSPGLPLNMGAELKEILPLINGKGGGNPTTAQGGGTCLKQLPQALDAALLSIRNKLEQSNQ